MKLIAYDKNSRLVVGDAGNTVAWIFRMTNDAWKVYDKNGAALVSMGSYTTAKDAFKAVKEQQ